jgi:Flp pilus assembly protein TadG
MNRQFSRGAADRTMHVRRERSGCVARIAREIRDDAGSSLIESAVSFVFLVAAMFGIFQMSLALFAYHYVSDEAREASRYASVRGSQCTNLTNCGATSAEIQSYIQGTAFPGINMSNVGVTATWLSASTSQPTTWSACNNQCDAPGNQVKVVVTYPFSLSIPLIPKSTINLSSTSVMVIAN